MSDIIRAVTNPEEIYEPKTEEEKNKEYASHIQQEIEDLAVCYTKLSDFIDNGLKIRDITDTRFQFKLAKKYLLVYRIFINRIKRADISLSENIKNQIIDDLSQAEIVATEIIENQTKYEPPRGSYGGN